MKDRLLFGAQPKKRTSRPGRCCWRCGTTCRTCAWLRRGMIAPASGWFRGLAAQEPTPGRTAFGRFRAGLVRRGLDRPLFEAVTRQLDARRSPPPMSTMRPGWMSSCPAHLGMRMATVPAWAASRPPRNHPDKGAADAVRMARAAGPLILAGIMQDQGCFKCGAEPWLSADICHVRGCSRAPRPPLPRGNTHPCGAILCRPHGGSLPGRLSCGHAGTAGTGSAGAVRCVAVPDAQ